MSNSNANLHGSAPGKSKLALLLIDVINDLEFEEGDKVLEAALPMAQRIVQLKRRAKAAGVPCVYVNDNFRHWKSDFRAQVRHCLQDGVRGEPLVQMLVPEEDDYFVLKPKHSGFFSTALELLLVHLEAERLILVGIAANNCVLFTANDAYMREFSIIVPSDCVASNSPDDTRYALAQMQKVLKADTRPSTELAIESLQQDSQTRSAATPRAYG